MFSWLAGLIFLMGFFAHIGLSARFVLTQRSLGYKVPRDTLVWNSFYGIGLATLALWGFMGIVDGFVFAPIAPLITTPAILALSQVTIRRNLIFEQLRSKEPALRHRIEWSLVALFSLLGMLMIEVPWSWAVGLYGPTYWWLELILVGLLTLFFYLVGRRRGSLTLPAWAFCAFVGVAQYFVRKFKNSAIMPNDILVLQDGATVKMGHTTVTFHYQ